MSVCFALLPGMAFANDHYDTAAKIEPGETSWQSFDDDAKRSPDGQVSVLNTHTNNPYNKQVKLTIDVGSEFALFSGSDISEGYVVKCGAGDLITLPEVHAKPGYTFIGWGQGGVPDEISWDVFTRQVQMTDDISDDENKTSIYALYMDDDGNGYCTCGAYREGAYSNQIDKLKENYDEYLHSVVRTGSLQKIIGGNMISIALIVLIGIAFLVPVHRTSKER